MQKDLTTNRLILRTVLESDWQEILFLRSNKEVNTFINRPPERQTRTKEDALSFINIVSEGNNCYWGLQKKEDRKLIGSICLWNFSDDKSTAELGYDLMPQYQGNGFMTEAAKEVLQFAVEELQLKCIRAYTHKNNLGSIKLLRLLDFKFQPELKDLSNKFNVIYSKDIAPK